MTRAKSKDKAVDNARSGSLIKNKKIEMVELSS